MKKTLTHMLINSSAPTAIVLALLSMPVAAQAQSVEANADGVVTEET